MLALLGSDDDQIRSIIAQVPMSKIRETARNILTINLFRPEVLQLIIEATDPNIINDCPFAKDPFVNLCRYYFSVALRRNNVVAVRQVIEFSKRYSHVPNIFMLVFHPMEVVFHRYAEVSLDHLVNETNVELVKEVLDEVLALMKLEPKFMIIFDCTIDQFVAESYPQQLVAEHIRKIRRERYDEIARLQEEIRMLPGR